MTAPQIAEAVQRMPVDDLTVILAAVAHQLMMKGGRFQEEAPFVRYSTGQLGLITVIVGRGDYGVALNQMFDKIASSRHQVTTRTKGDT
jgi:hypothetical protein